MTPRKTKTGNVRFGRPRVQPDKARSQRIVTFVTPEELKQLRELADSSGKSISALVHEQLTRKERNTSRS